MRSSWLDTHGCCCGWESDPGFASWLRTHDIACGHRTVSPKRASRCRRAGRRLDQARHVRRDRLREDLRQGRVRDGRYTPAGRRSSDATRGRAQAGASPLIVDLGASVGLSAIWFAQVWPFATVLAIEPHEENFRLLQRNVARYPNITPIQAGNLGQPGHARDPSTPWP